MTIPKKVSCPTCKHLHRGEELETFTCAAFSKGIPEPIYMGLNDHRESYPGDGGIQYEPLDELVVAGTLSQ